MDRAIEIIRKRTDAFGVSEPEISRIGSDSIRVGLPDVSNAANASRQVGQTAQMYFYDWEPNVIPNPAKTNVPNGESSFSRALRRGQGRLKADAGVLPEQVHDQRARSTTSSTRRPTPTSRARPTTARTCSRSCPGQKQPPNSQILTVPQGTLVVQKEPARDSRPRPDTTRKNPAAQWFVISDRPALSGTDITDPKPNSDQARQPDVTFGFTGKGRPGVLRRHQGDRPAWPAERTPRRRRATRRGNGYSGHFAVVLDQSDQVAPDRQLRRQPRRDRRAHRRRDQRTHFSRSRHDLSQILQIGALPVTLNQISSSTVSATLGQQALNQGLKAGIVGLILVCLFLLIYYRFLGFVAVVGLAIYGVLFFALIKLIPITLTLPGIAGLILTIGVAADANIVIFERIKEEASGGKSMLSAISAGYRSGIATIVDANVITLITAFILFALATSNVKGFAFILGVGTIASLFTAVVFTQAFLGLFGRAHFLRSPAVARGARSSVPPLEVRLQPGEQATSSRSRAASC